MENKFPKEIIHMEHLFKVQSNLDKRLTSKWFFMVCQRFTSKKTEIGDNVPKGSYQILGLY